MNKNRLKKVFVIFLSFVMVLSILSTSKVFALEGVKQKPEPRLVSGLKLVPDVLEIDGGDTVSFRASFMDTQSTPEPVTVTTTNGGVLSAESESDIEIVTGGVKKAITDLEINEDCNVMQFMTSTLAAKKQTTIDFKVTAPLGASSIDVAIQIGTGIGYKKVTIKIISGLTIEAPEEASDEDVFYITGNASYKGKQPPQPSYIFAEIINKETGQPMDEIQYISEIVDQRYSIGPLTLPSTYDDAIYVINVYMMYDDIYLLGTASKDIKYVKVDKTEELTLKPDKNIYADSREVQIIAVDQNQKGIPYTSVQLSVTGEAALSKNWVSTNAAGEAVITVSDAADEYVILTGTTTGGKKVTIPVDFREIPNLAFNQKVTVSDVLADDNEVLDGEKVIDGFTDSRWSSGNSNSWIEIEFDEARAFDKVTIRPFEDRNAPVYAYRIEYYSEGQWKKAYEGNYTATDAHVEARFPEVKGNKFRLSLNGENASIYELSIFDTHEYLLTVWDTVIGTNKEGDVITESKTMRSYPYAKDEDIIPIKPLEHQMNITVIIPKEYSEYFEAGNGNIITGKMPEMNVKVTYEYRYIIDEDPNTVKINVIEEHGKVFLTDSTKAFNFIWVANSSKGTVVKINTDTGEIVGEYKTSPEGQPANPSRTTVDKDGNVWVTNRDGNSVIKIGLAENGQWIDKNGNGICDTSVGLKDVKDWKNTGDADTLGGVSTAEDECILLYVRVSSSGTRHLSIDKDNNVWVSGTGNRVFDLIESSTGKILRSEGSVGFGGYGGLIDKNGVIWSSNPFLRWDTNKPLSGPNGVNWSGISNTNGSSYGLAIDSQGNVWNTNHGGDGKIRKYRSDGTLIGAYPQGDVTAQGCVVGKYDDVWVAHSLSKNTIGHLKNDGTYIGTITLNEGSDIGPTGVAVDDKGYIWATCYDGYVYKIDPDDGDLGADNKTKIGKVVFTTPNLEGTLYNYSDMTGSTLIGAPGTGTWEFIHDSKADNTYWNKISWEPMNQDKDAIQVYLSSRNDDKNFSKPQMVENNSEFKIPNGRYVKVTVRLNRPESGISPVVEKIFISSIPYE